MSTKEQVEDHDQMDSFESVEVYDPVKKCHFRILVKQQIDPNDNEDIASKRLPVQNWTSCTTWTQHETLALINIFSLNKDTFKDFKKKKGQWNLISEELKKIGIEKLPEKCEIKWKNLLRVYRQHKHDKKGPGKFEFFNELDDIIANDPQFRYIIANPSSSTNSLKNKKGSIKIGEPEMLNNKRKCYCMKSEKQKRHEDRIALMNKKMEIEERKVRVFEDYLKFLKASSANI